MKQIFDDIKELDKRCCSKYLLTDDILMENASSGICRFIKKKFKKNKTILIVAGSGNNGADAITLARMLNGYFDKLSLYIPFGVKSDMAKLQLKRAYAVNVNIVTKIKKADIYVEALFGTGINRKLGDDVYSIIKKLNELDGYKIACDIPTGIYSDGSINQIAFKANVTITMGALKTSLFSDIAKNYVGKIKIVNLGVDLTKFQTKSNKFLLTKKDLSLPNREDLSTNKGNFGHLAVISGDKLGASYLSAISGFHFGAGLVSVIGDGMPSFIEIINSKKIAKNTTAICLGMGLGKNRDDIVKNILKLNIPTVLDADMFYNKYIVDFLSKDNIILTPHPKEFASLLLLTGMCDLSVKEIIKDRFSIVEDFSNRYPNVVLLLKGANSLIAYKNNIYINRYGINNLSKGGSGDVLSGLIGALLAQGFSTIKSAINGSLAHTIASKKIDKNSYALNPKDIIDKISVL